MARKIADDSTINWTGLDTILAKLAIRDAGLDEQDMDILRGFVNQRVTEQEIKKHIKGRLPYWDGRTHSLPFILSALQDGLLD